jgi:hypothetical protein
VKAIWWIALVAEPVVPSCQALFETMDAPGADDPRPGLEPIDGSVELGGAESGGANVGTSPSPSLLARGSFTSHGIAAELDATGSGADVAGTLALSQSNTDNRATVDLECARTTADGLIEIGGVVTDSLFDVDDQAEWHEGFPEGRGVVVIFEPGDPVKSIWWVTLADDDVSSCGALFDTIDRSEDEILPGSPGMDPIQGTVDFGP